jgi:hypothetical protein
VETSVSTFFAFFLINSLGHKARHWLSGIECEGESATAGGPFRGGEAGGDGVGSAGAVTAVHVGGSAAAGVSSDVQSVYGWWAPWHACRYGDSRDGDDGAEDQDGCFGYVVLVGGGYVRGDSVKLPAGHMVLYPATSLHRVAPVTRGARLASFFWVQSMIRSDGDRTLLYDLDTAIQRLAVEVPGNPVGVQLTAVYHNLLRRWAEM